MTLTVEDRQLPTMYRQCWANRVEIYLAAAATVLGLEKISTNLALPLYQGGYLENVRQLAIAIFMIIPLVFIHLIVAQYGNQGPIGIWQCFPIGKGIGFATAILCFLQCIHVSPLVAGSAYYLFETIKSLVNEEEYFPWECAHTGTSISDCSKDASPEDTLGSWLPHKENSTASLFFQKATGEQEYPSVNGNLDLLSIQLLTPMAIAQGCIWFLVLCFLCWGIKSLAKVLYFTVPLMFVLFIILLGRAASLKPGVFTGLNETYGHRVNEWMKEAKFEERIPDFAKKLEVGAVTEFSTIWNWGRSISHVLFTLGIPFGVIFTLGSYNRYNANTIRDASLISLSAALLPMIFGILLGCLFGHYAAAAGVSLTSLVPWPGGFNGYVEHSSFMLFVRMPQVLSIVQPAPAAWLFIFYSLATILGIHSLCIYAETVRACIQDLCPKCLKTKNLGHAIGVTIGVIFLLCAGSLATATNRSNFITQTLSITIALPLPFMMLLGALLLIFGYAISHYRSHFKSIVNSDLVRSGKCPWVLCVIFIVVGCLTVPIGLVLQTAFTYCFEAHKWVLDKRLTTDGLAPPVSQDNWASFGFVIAVEAIVLLLIFLTMIFKCVSKCRTPYVRLCHPETDWEAVAPNGMSPGTEADNGFEFRNFTPSSGYTPKSPSAPTYYTST